MCFKEIGGGDRSLVCVPAYVVFIDQMSVKYLSFLKVPIWNLYLANHFAYICMKRKRDEKEKELQRFAASLAYRKNLVDWVDILFDVCIKVVTKLLK